MSRLKKTLIAVILTAAFGFGSLTAFGWTPSDYTITAGTANWQTKYNNFINAIYGQIMQLSALINNWAIEDNIITMVQATPTYSSATAFTLPGDYTSRFTAGKVVQVQVAAGMVYSSVASSTYSAPNTIVNLHDSLLTNPISRVYVVATRNGLWPNGPGYVVARDYGSDRAALEAADAVAAAAGKQLLIGNPYTIDQDVTLSSAVKMMPGAVLTRSGGTHLTIKGKFEGCDGCFADNTATHNWVVFGPGAAKEAAPQWWGGTACEYSPTPAVASTAALQAAMNAFPAYGGGVVNISAYFGVDADLYCPRNISLQGLNPWTSGLISTTSAIHKVHITEVSSLPISEIRQTVDCLNFYKVGLAFGESDFLGAYGLILSNSSIHDCQRDTAVYMGYGAWGYQIFNCRIYGNRIGLDLDCTQTDDAVYRSGDPVTISNCSITNNYDLTNTTYDGAGIRIRGVVKDGMDIKISNADLQHNDYGLYAVNTDAVYPSRVGAITLTDPHFELCRVASIYNARYAITVNGLWAGAGNTANWIAQIISNDPLSYTRINSAAWLDYSTPGLNGGTLCKLITGSLYLNYPQIRANPIYLNGDPNVNQITGNYTIAGNLKFPQPYVYNKSWGGSQAITLTPYTLDWIWPGDVNPHHYKLHLTQTAGTDIGEIMIRLSVGATNYDNHIGTPNESGNIDADVWVTADKITMTLRFDGPAVGGTHQTYYSQVPNGRTVAQQANIRLINVGSTAMVLNNSVMSIE